MKEYLQEKRPDHSDVIIGYAFIAGLYLVIGVCIGMALMKWVF